jgi:hypothetical protein
MNYKPPFNDTLPNFPIDPGEFGVLFYHEFRNFTETEIHRVELLKKGYTGDIFEIKYSTNPVTLGHVGTGKDEWENEVIQAQSVTFDFVIPQSDEGIYNSLIFESDFHEIQLKYTIDGATEFIGWVQPENLSKNYSRNSPNLQISITAYDGLVDLKDFEFVNDIDDSFDDASEYSGRIMLLEILKTALSRTGIPLNFAIELNTYSGAEPPPVPPVKVLASEGLDIQFAITTEDGKLIIIEDITF